jgi:hypothetical protein
MRKTTGVSCQDSRLSGHIHKSSWSKGGRVEPLNKWNNSVTSETQNEFQAFCPLHKDEKDRFIVGRIQIYRRIITEWLQFRRQLIISKKSNI